ncbi:unnamed protein product [Closterium sp. NIES-53]
MKRLSLASSTRASLNEDSLTLYILQDEAMQEAERPSELLAQVNCVAPVKQGGRPGQRGQSGGGGSSGWKPTKDADKKKLAKDSDRGGSRRRECWLCGNPNHLSFVCPDRSDSDDDETKGGLGRAKRQGGVVLAGQRWEPTVSLAPEAGEDFQAMAAAVQVNQEVVLLDSGCSHHLVGMKAAFVDLGPSGNVKHVRGFNGALQDVQGRGTVALQGEAGKQVLIPGVLYVPGVRANLLSADQLKENGVKLQEDGDGMLLVSAAGDVLGRASYTGRVLCTDLRPCLTRSPMPPTEIVALRAIVSATKSTPDRLHARLAHVDMDTNRISAKHKVAIGLDLKSALGAHSPCVSCVGGKLARHTFPNRGSDAADMLAVVHIDLCRPFRVAAKDGSLYFLRLKDRKTRYVWVRLVAKKSNVLLELAKWLAMAERQTKKSVLMLRSDRGGEFLGKQFTDFVDGKGIIHDLTCPYTLQKNNMAEREMRTVVESVRTMLLHMGVQHHWWHLALRQAIWVHNCLERSALPPGTTPYQLFTGTKPDLSMARVWGCMAQFLVPEQQRGGKMKLKARWGLHLGVSTESKGWELLDIADNWVVTTSDVVFYENMSLEVWKSEHGPASGRTLTTSPTDTSTATLHLLAEVGEPAAEDVEDVSSPSPSPAPPFPPLVADLRRLTPASASGDEGSSEASPKAPTKSITGGCRDVQQVDMRVMSMSAREEQAEEVQPTMVNSAKGAAARQQPTGEQAAAKLTTEQSVTGQSTGELNLGEQSAGTPTMVQQDAEGGDDSRIRKLPEFFVPAIFIMVYEVGADDLVYDDAEDDDELPELDPDMHANPEHRWDISTMTVKEALASWKGVAVKAAMEEEIRSLVVMWTWELVERLPGENIVKNRWVLTTKCHIDDTVERKKARLDVKGFTQVNNTDHDETYVPVSSYVTPRIFLSIVAVLYLNLMQLDMKNAFLQRKLDRVLYMHQPDYFNNGTGRELKELLEAAFELREISLVQKYLRLEIVRDRSARKLWLHQQGYADKLRRRFLDEEQNGHTLKTPVSVNAYATFTFDDEEAQLGSGLTVRSDQHWHEVDHCLAYLANTRDTALEFGGGVESLKLVGYVDADDAGDKQNRTSTGGYVFVFGGATVSWSSQRIKCATLSSTESEYVAGTEAGKEGRRLRFLLAEFRQLDARTLTVLRVDNKSAITVAKGMGLMGNLKHMERQQAWLQHMVKCGKFSLRYISTAEQLADFLTKAMHYPAFNRCSIAIGQVRLVDMGDGDNDVQH